MHIEIAVSEKNKIVSHENCAKYTYENVYSMIRDAYDAAWCQFLADFARFYRGDVKSHQHLQHNENYRLFLYGFKIQQ